MYTYLVKPEFPKGIYQMEVGHDTIVKHDVIVSELYLIESAVQINDRVWLGDGIGSYGEVVKEIEL